MITRRRLMSGAAAFAGALALSLATAVPAFAADINGKWKSEFTGPDGNSRTNVFTFEVKGETVDGTVTSSMAPEPAKIEEGTLKGDEIPLKVSADAGGQTFEVDIVAKREK